MRFFEETPQFDFLSKTKITTTLSVVLILIAIASIFLHQGLNYGIDFRGGTNVQVQLSQPFDLNEIRTQFREENITNFLLQTFGEEKDYEILLILPTGTSLGTGEELTINIRNILQPVYPNLEIRRVETIGPKVGEELKSSAFNAILISIVGILIYISFRFQWRFGVGSIVAILHDVMIVVGFFSIFDKEFTLTVIAALLTVVGYSLNDTIVVFDRIRENLGRFRKKSLIEVINFSINETLSRTLLTSGTTLFVVLSLYILGGEIIHDFAFALLVGVIVGTYSSIYIASPCILWLNHKFPIATNISKNTSHSK